MSRPKKEEIRLRNGPTQADYYEPTDFKRGSIYRMKLVNFVTYNDVEFFPGPKLNVVLGPNGSGKSSIVCAIALGLGGLPSILGRAQQIREFIRHGADFAIIEIELASGSDRRNIVVTRKLLKTNASEWRLQGKVVTQTVVRERIADLNIQVHNLCQFLPQDKVVELARQDTCHRLKETESAVGGAKMLEQHMQLIKLRKDKKSYEVELKEKEKELEKWITKRNLLQPQVVRYREFLHHQEVLSILRKRRPWMVYEDAKAPLAALEEDLREEKKKLEAKKRDEEPLRKQAAKDTNTMKKYKEMSRKCQEKLKHVSKSIRNRSLPRFDTLTDEFDKLCGDLKQLEEVERKRKQTIAATKKKILDMQKKLETCGSLEDLEAKKENIAKTYREVTVKSRQARDAKTDAEDRVGSNIELNRAREELRRLDNVHHRRLQVIRSRRSDVYSAYIWIQERIKRGGRENPFRKAVYGPIVLDISCPDPVHTKFLEQALPSYCLFAFVVQCEEDRATLMTELREKQNLRITVLYSDPDAASASRSRQARPAQMKNLEPFGITHWLDEVFEAPPVVKTALKNITSITQTAVGTAHTETCKRDLFAAVPHLNLLYTPTTSNRRTKSRYSSSFSTSVDQVREANFLSCIDVNKRNQLQQKISEFELAQKEKQKIVHQLAQEEQKWMHELAKVRSQRDEIQKEILGVRRLKSRISQLHATLQDEENTEDRKIQEVRIMKHLAKVNTDREHEAVKVVKTMQMASSLYDKLSENQLAVMELASRIMEYERRIREYHKLRKDLENVVSQKNAKLLNQREIAKRAKAQAQSVSRLTPELKEAFNREDCKCESLTELDARMEVLQAQVDSMVGLTAEIVKDFDDCVQKIETLEKAIEKEKELNKRRFGQLDRIKQEWLPKVQKMVDDISERFRGYFQQIGCDGKIVLNPRSGAPALSEEEEARQAESEDSKDNDDEDFQYYGLEIHVKYRDSAKLAQLDSRVQSGGERAVATILFLISLQLSIQAPFRLVDEINQGMDAKNERAVFQIVEKAMHESEGQFFMITPKLLANLPLDRCTVLCVFNGVHQMMQDEWDRALFAMLTDFS